MNDEINSNDNCNNRASSLIDSPNAECIELQSIEGLSVFDQRTLEDNVSRQVNNAILEIGNFGTTSTEIDAQNDNEIVRNEHGDETKLQKTEIERTIELGEMTPFGSVVTEQVRRTVLIDKPADNIDKQYYTSEMLEPISSEENDSGSEYQPSEDCDDDEDEDVDNFSDCEHAGSSARKTSEKRNRKSKNLTSSRKRFKNNLDVDESLSDKLSQKRVRKIPDDGSEYIYERRIKKYEESHNSDVLELHVLDNCDFQLPLNIWSKLYKYQKIGVQWLYELYDQESGGILSDEMGLGKSIQVIAFLAGLYCSRRILPKRLRYNNAGSLIICPVTVMQQWVKEMHTWFPPIRAAVLHQTGNFVGNKKQLIKDIYKNRGVLITSYGTVIKYQEYLTCLDWNCVILDEGHKICNPDSQITLAVKQFRTPHRLILSGSPIQNNLKELWSLFDFVCPGKLGTLPIFLSTFSYPITQGEYANASKDQIATAFKCASILKDMISPYLLRRLKSDVESHIHLPSKTEQVLFCKLTEIQSSMYKNYINSAVLDAVLMNRGRTLTALMNLRKLCNHPDLLNYAYAAGNAKSNSGAEETEVFGHWSRSGKMIVVRTLLKIWKKQNHKVLIFTQGVKMLKILEKFLSNADYSYLKLDGGTSVNIRQTLIDSFNKNPSIFIMLLTTRVGGLGVNLTGANRVLIYDPDWNPTIDTQARERAWRIGQQQHVIIYRLLTAGTIEEKIYHRQIFKQLLTNKVLKDPGQYRFYKSNNFIELFQFHDTDKNGLTETAAIFSGTGAEIRLGNAKKRHRKRSDIEHSSKCVKFSESKLMNMRKMAQMLSKKVAEIAKSGICNESEKKEEKESVALEKSQEELPKSISDDTAVIDEEADKKINNEEEPTFSLMNDKERKFKGTEFEDYSIPHLVSCESAKEEEEQSIDISEESRASSSLSEADQDNYVLEKLFSKSGLCTALIHDKIVDSGASDYALVERKAENTAKQALEAVKKSRSQCFGANDGIPNWTGQHGKINVKNILNCRKSPVSGTVSSSEILKRMRSNNCSSQTTSFEIDLASEIVQFLNANGGKCETNSILEKFRRQVSVDHTALFKCLLTNICTFHKSSNTNPKAYWELKSEFCNN